MVTDRGIEGPPDLVGEVVSPSTATRDRGIKLGRYRLHGVAEYWVVDPDEHTVDVWDVAGDASEAVVLRAEDTLSWTPAEGAGTLSVALADLFGAR